VNACLDRNADNRGDATAICTGGNCTATFTPASAATVAGNQRQAVVQLFYTNNIVHDIQFKYGFNQASGNFEGADAVAADAQDGSGTCNANFSTQKTNGTAARMQMFTCNQTNPTRDGDLDLGVIIHEYGHGVSIRQVGGNTTCQISGLQQPGEGWSDILALIYTAKATDTATLLRGEGAYFFGLSTATGSGATIRRQPYVGTGTRNTLSFASLRTLSETHDVAEVWAEALYRVYWSVLSRANTGVPFDVNLANFTPNGALGTAATAANKRVLFYINEGFKNTRCSTNGAGTTFINTRDGVLAAARANFGGVDMCAVARGFAAMGLGTGAATNGQVGTRATITTSTALPAGCTATN
jgi:extracellular elastinolytic metalloproteinase